MVSLKWKPTLALLALAGAALLYESLYGQKYFFRVKRFRIGQKDSNKTVRILLLTDLHFRHRTWPFHRKLARTINSLRPDLLLIAGDVIDTFGEAAPARAFFSWVNKSIPKLAIPGNHDHLNGVSLGRLKKIFEDHNGYLLVNETRKINIAGVPFTISGLDDFIEGKPSLEAVFKGLRREQNHLLLVHSPLQQEAVLEEVERRNRGRSTSEQLNIAYIFAGHNHGGQVRLGPLVPVLPKGSGHYVNGWYNDSPPYLYVSKGFGTSVLPLRFGARSEVTLFEYGLE